MVYSLGLKSLLVPKFLGSDDNLCTPVAIPGAFFCNFARALRFIHTCLKNFVIFYQPKLLEVHVEKNSQKAVIQAMRKSHSQ